MGFVPILEKDWKTIPAELSDKYIMLGLPQQLINSRVVNENEDSRVIGSVVPVGIIIERLKESPEQILKTTYPRFVGRLDFGNSKSSFEDITGMSGGPIIGFNEALNRYWVVAVQSSWLPESKITFGCLIPVFAQLVEDWLQDSKPSQITE